MIAVTEIQIPQIIIAIMKIIENLLFFKTSVAATILIILNSKNISVVNTNESIIQFIVHELANFDTCS